MSTLKELSAAATPGSWYTVDTPWGNGAWIVAGNPDPHVGIMVCDCQDVNETRPEDGPSAQDDAAFVAALVTAYRSGRLIEAPAPDLAQGEPVAWIETGEPSTLTDAYGFLRASPEKYDRFTRPLYDRPAPAPRPSEDEIKSAIQHALKFRPSADYQGTPEDAAAEAVLALFLDPAETNEQGGGR